MNLTWILAALLIFQLCTSLLAQDEESVPENYDGRPARKQVTKSDKKLPTKTEPSSSSSSSPTANQLLSIKSKLKPRNGNKEIYIQNQLGRFVPSLTASETVGIRGPITLKDTNFIEHLAHFDRERIPERVVHAKGAGAFGVFKVTHDITKFSKACVFEPKTETKILIRFSTVGGKSGSSDLAHDPRGFAIKFYTKCGNFDLPGNNLETFPIRDPILFPSLIHSRKKNPQTNCDDPNMWWDFTSLRPESTFHTIQLFSYLGFPDGFRFMDGAGVHTYKLINAEGGAVYCKFHFISKNGYRNMTMEEAAEIGGKNPEYSTQDLFDAIELKDFPSWDLQIQTMTFEQAAKVPFHPFDVTKVWPRDKYPLKPVGTFTLNTNPEDYFKDIEMAAFDPGNLIPGIETSPDRMLQGRSFSYSDTQRYRLGTNFLELPVNRPANFDSLQTYQRDGMGLFSRNGAGLPNYYPNSFYNHETDPDSRDLVDRAVTGDILRTDTGDEDNFSQPRNWYNERSDAEKSAIASNIANALKPVYKEVRIRAINNFGEVSPQLKKDILYAL